MPTATAGKQSVAPFSLLAWLPIQRGKKGRMGFLTNLYSQNKFDVTKTFNSLRDIRWRAEHILEKKNRTPEQFESAAKGIHDFIAEYKNEKLAEEIENYAQQIYERGGWQLDYLDGFDYDRQPSMSEIRGRSLN